MFKQFLVGLFCSILLVSFSGCAVRTYSQVKNREDQKMMGNAGFLIGNPPSVDRSKIKKTRKTYVLEIKTPSAVNEEHQIETMVDETEKAIQETREGLSETQRALDMRGKGASASGLQSQGASIGSEEYTIEKNDTLQKISMKFFNTTRKWQKIYEYNKEVIKDPNRIKPGSVIKIPKE